MLFLSFLVLIEQGCAEENGSVVLKSRHGGTYSPSKQITVLPKKLDKEWAGYQTQITAWCFFSAANFAIYEDKIWAINGIARSHIKGGAKIYIQSKEIPVYDAYSERDASSEETELLAKVNDKMNVACP